jgi:hypothetical protein
MICDGLGLSVPSARRRLSQQYPTYNQDTAPGLHDRQNLMKQMPGQKRCNNGLRNN